MTPEGRVKKACYDFLEERGCYIHKAVQFGYGKRTLDALVCWRGRFIGIEFKRPGGKRPAHQIQTAREITCAGGLTLLIESKEELVEIWASIELAVVQPIRVPIST